MILIKSIFNLKYLPKTGAFLLLPLLLSVSRDEHTQPRSPVTPTPNTVLASLFVVQSSCLIDIALHSGTPRTKQDSTTFPSYSPCIITQEILSTSASKSASTPQPDFMQEQKQYVGVQRCK
ncbi:hypothetical protein BJ878DRAFT_527594 [Calycina marina]|uniref:Uncharacterized protein n=1 Tax=Calycina marina TaxID=1763456 RepID=A0A9P8CAR3_9HELO|nr:hypothetical protein BJ878DRAFT_527594 [Calycina marina]